MIRIEMRESIADEIEDWDDLSIISMMEMAGKEHLILIPSTLEEELKIKDFREQNGL